MGSKYRSKNKEERTLATHCSIYFQGDDHTVFAVGKEGGDVILAKTQADSFDTQNPPDDASYISESVYRRGSRIPKHQAAIAISKMRF